MAKYYTQLTNDKPELIKVEVELSKTELERARRNTDSKPSATTTEIIKKLIKMHTSRSIVKNI